MKNIILILLIAFVCNTCKYTNQKTAISFELVDKHNADTTFAINDTAGIKAYLKSGMLIAKAAFEDTTTCWGCRRTNSPVLIYNNDVRRFRQLYGDTTLPIFE